jgi:hypothetical protein
MAPIFISYARKDVEAANRLRGTLAKAGYEAWIDQEIPGGDLWKKRIVEAIEVAQAFLVLLSPNSVGSDNVRKELDMADSRKKLIFPLVIAPMKIPHEMEYSLAGLQRIDFVTDPGAGDRQLLSALKSLHAIEQQNTEWAMGETKERRKKLNAILTDPSRSIREKIDDFGIAFQEPTRQAWQKKRDNVSARQNAIVAEQDLLRKKKETLLRELVTASSDEIRKLIYEKVGDISRQQESLLLESSALRDEELALIDESQTQRDKMSEGARKMLEESNKLVERFWKKDD